MQPIQIATEKKTNIQTNIRFMHNSELVFSTFVKIFCRKKNTEAKHKSDCCILKIDRQLTYVCDS